MMTSLSLRVIWASLDWRGMDGWSIYPQDSNPSDLRKGLADLIGQMVNNVEVGSILKTHLSAQIKRKQLKFTWDFNIQRS